MNKLEESTDEKIEDVIKKMQQEQKEKELEGYVEYKKKVKYRIIPFIW